MQHPLRAPLLFPQAQDPAHDADGVRERPAARRAAAARLVVQGSNPR
jgi:hypothetical protein